MFYLHKEFLMEIKYYLSDSVDVLPESRCLPDSWYMRVGISSLPS